MKNTNKKRGFTIIELVIVVAVIAILTAVLVPTFAGVIRRANEAADTALIKNLNTALVADVDGCDTMSEALAAAAEQGFDVAKISAKASDNKILWDSVNNVFCYEKDGKISYIPDFDAEEHDDKTLYWTVATAPSATYSTYLYGASGAITASTGVDVGNCDITSVTYNGTNTAKSVSIFTNGGTLTINAPLDDVAHYGNVDEVNIVKVANSSYYENGEVSGFITIKSGHLVLNAKNDYVVKVDAVASDIASGSTFVNVTAAKGSVQLYADADVIQAVKNTGNAVFSGVNTEEAKAKDDLKKITTVAELENIIAEVNAGTVVAPAVYLAEGEYQFTGVLTIKKSIEIVGVPGKTVLLGYDNNTAKAGNAFNLKVADENQVISFAGLSFDGFGLYKDRASGTLVASNVGAYSGIWAQNVESTVVNVTNCNFTGMAHDFINVKGGTYNISGCYFDGSLSSYDWPNVVQFGDYTGALKTTANFSDSTFVGAGVALEDGVKYSATLLSPWANSDFTVKNCHFENSFEAISGGSEYYDYTGEFSCTGSTFVNCGKEIRIARWVDSLSDIPGNLSDYKIGDSSYSDMENVDLYILETTNSDGNAVTYVYYYEN